MSELSNWKTTFCTCFWSVQKRCSTFVHKNFIISNFTFEFIFILIGWRGFIQFQYAKKKYIVLRINCNLIKVVLKYTQNNIQIIQNWKVFLCYRNLSSRDKATKFNLARKAKISKHFLATFIYIWKTLSDCYTS